MSLKNYYNYSWWTRHKIEPHALAPVEPVLYLGHLQNQFSGWRTPVHCKRHLTVFYKHVRSEFMGAEREEGLSSTSGNRGGFTTWLIRFKLSRVISLRPFKALALIILYFFLTGGSLKLYKSQDPGDLALPFFIWKFSELRKFYRLQKKKH